MESLVVLLSVCVVLQWAALAWIMKEMVGIQNQIGDALKLIKRHALLIKSNASDVNKIASLLLKNS